MKGGRFRCSGAEEVRLAANVVGPGYYAHFAQPLLDAVTPGSGEVVLNVQCHTGSLARKLHAQLGGGRVVAVDNDDGLIDYARRVAHAEQRVFFKREDSSSLSFGKEAFDLAVGVIADTPLDCLGGLLSELRRVVCLHRGRVLLSVAAARSIQPLLEMLDEVARFEGDTELRIRLQTHPETTFAQWTKGARAAGFETIQCRPESFRLPYRSAREIPDDPLARSTFWPGLLRLASSDEKVAEARLRAAVERLAVYTCGGPLALPVQLNVLTLS
ncbi:MAG: class I SAM-dependent methyltransferase [Polyangiales bacterium]